MRVIQPESHGLAAEAAFARPRLARMTDALLLVTVLVLPVYPWLAAREPNWAPSLRLALGVALVAVVVMEARRQGRRALALTIVLILIAGLQVIAALRAPDLEYGVRELANWTLYLPVALLAWSSRRLALLAWGVSISGVILLLGALLQIEGHLGGAWGVPSAGDESLTRLTSFLQNPNDFGLAMALCAVVAIALALVSHGRRRAVLVALVCAFAFGVVASTSRGSLLALLLGCVALAIVRFRRRAVSQRRFAVAPVVLIVLLISVVTIGSIARDFRHSIAGVVVHGDASAQARLDRWSALVGEPLNPVFGSGYGGFAAALDRDPPELLLNPGAEEGLLGWVSLAERASISLVSSPVREGRGAVQLIGNGATSSLRIGIGGGRTSIIPGRRFRFSVAVNSSKPAIPVAASLSVIWQQRSSPRSVEIYGAQRFLDVPSWQVLSEEFAAPPAAEFATPVVTIATMRRSLLFYLDSARFRRVDPIFAPGSEPPIWALRGELTVDNSFLRLVLEEGLAGVVVFFAAFLVALSYRPSVSLPSTLLTALPVIVLTMLSVRALTADLVSQPLWSFLIWLSIGLVAAISSIRQDVTL